MPQAVTTVIGLRENFTRGKCKKYHKCFGIVSIYIYTGSVAFQITLRPSRISAISTFVDFSRTGRVLGPHVALFKFPLNRTVALVAKEEERTYKQGTRKTCSQF